jgi:ankyrin repeat protein
MQVDYTDYVDRYGRTSLHIESERGNRNGVLRLLEQGYDIDLGDDTERTALHYAVLNGHHGVVDTLLKHGADVNIEDENGNIPLLLVRKNFEEVLPLLIHAGIDINSKNYEKQTLLHIAAAKRDVKFVRMLLLHGADKNLQDMGGLTPLHSAEKAKNSAVVELLAGIKSLGGLDSFSA